VRHQNRRRALTAVGDGAAIGFRPGGFDPSRERIGDLEGVESSLERVGGDEEGDKPG
jgi:hypothetical protein